MTDTATGRYGPNTAQVEQLLELVKGATPDQVSQLAAARDAARIAAWSAAWDAAWSAARSAARDGARFAARFAAWSADRDGAGDAARHGAWFAAWDAAAALVVADLVGQHGYTQDHHDTLMGPARKAFGHEDTWGTDG